MLLFTPIESHAQWIESNGHYGGEIHSITISGTNIFIGSYGGGVLLSTDNGLSWRAVNSGLTDTSVLSLTSFNGNLFAGTDGSGVFLSTNNGISWNPINSGLTNGHINVLTVSGGILFASTQGGIFRSTDNGTNWTAFNNGLPYNLRVLLLVAIDTNLFIGTIG